MGYRYQQSLSRCITCYCKQNSRQKVVNRGALRLCKGTWHSSLTKIPLTYSVSYFNLCGLGAAFGRAKPTKAPGGDGTAAKVFAFNSHMEQNTASADYRNMKWTFEDLLLCYCYVIKTNSRTICSQVSQSVSSGKEADMSKLQAHHCILHNTRTVNLALELCECHTGK